MTAHIPEAGGDIDPLIPVFLHGANSSNGKTRRVHSNENTHLTWRTRHFTNSSSKRTQQHVNALTMSCKAFW